MPVEIELAMRRSFPEAFAKGKALVDNGQLDPRFLAENLVAKPRALNAEESVALIYDRMRLQNEHADVMGLIEKAQAKGDKEAEMEGRQRLAKLEDAINTNDIAARKTGYEQGLGLAARKMMIAQDYSLARTLQRARVATGLQELPVALREKLEAVTQELQKAIKKSDAYEEKIKKLEDQLSAKQLERKVRKAVVGEELRRKPRAESQAKIKSLAEKINSKLYHVNMVFDPDVVKLLGEMAKEYVVGGIIDAKEIVSEIYNELQSLTPNPDLTERDVRDAISGYGITAKLSQDELNVTLREARRQMRLISSLEDAESGEIPLRSGFQRDAMSDEVRDLQRQVRQAMRESGIDSTKSRSPEEQLKTALDAVKTRLRNQISDITRQLETGKKTPKKVGITYDQEANDLKAERDRLKKALEDIEGKPGMSDEQRIKMATAAVEKSIAEYERRIGEGDLEPRKKESKTPETTELKMLRARRDNLKDIYKQMVKDAKPEVDPQAAALKAYKTRTAKRIADLKEMLDTGRFEKSARRVLKLDPAGMYLKNQAEKLKDKVDYEIARLRKANRTRIEKSLDFGVKLRRAIILSGMGTIVKLTTAATLRTITTPIEEVIGLVLARTPYISRIAKKAPREGAGLNVRAEAAAFRQWFEKATWRDVIDVAKTGKGELDRLYGKKYDFPPEAIEFFGHIHGALKVTPKRAEFWRSLQQRTEWAIKNGYDMTDPTTMATITAASYIDANRAIFMNDNAAVTVYRMLIRYLDNHSLGTKVAATTLQMLIPIVKIPTNFVKETATYAGGGFYAAAKLIEKKGISNLTMDEADSILRSLKKQFLGLILLALGMAGASVIGGYYQRGEKRKASDVSASGIKIGKTEIPHLMLHTPALEVLQLGATIVRVYQTYSKYNLTHPPEDQKTRPLIAALYASSLGAAKQVPFFDQPLRMAEGVSSPEAAGQRFNFFLEGMFIPPDVRRIAKWQDMAGDLVIPRERKTFVQAFMASIPGERRKLPVDIASIKRMDISKVAELIENAPEGTFKGATKTDMYKLMDSKLKDGVRSKDISKDEIGDYVKTMKKLLPLDTQATPSKQKVLKRWQQENMQVR